MALNKDKAKRQTRVQKTVTVADRISIDITEIAFTKMIGLVKAFDGEVGWHGTVKRPDMYSFSIEDIYVYPQVATAASIDTDQYEYEKKWLMTHPDEIFNNFRMHGHSHVNFGVSPSTKDDRHRIGIVEKLTGDMFYIFMIWNKALKFHTLIYDCGTKLIYSNSHIDLYVTVKGKRRLFTEVTVESIHAAFIDADIGHFIQEAQSVVQT